MTTEVIGNEREMRLLKTVEEIGARLSPDDDWAPMLFGVDRDGKNVIVGIDGDFLASIEKKDALFQGILPMLVREQKLVEISTVLSVWVLKIDNPEPLDRDNLPVPSESPLRVEMVCITSIDPEGSHVFVAPIIRQPNTPPSLGAWERFADMEGRGVDNLLVALRRNRYPNGQA